jgi:5-methylcytosine-specific restriction endonuclease McrA
VAELTYDHVVPRAQGGITSWTNVVTCCIPCNARKGNRTPAQAGMPLRQAPVRPAPGNHATRVIPGSVVPEMWRAYLPSGCPPLS